MRMKLVVVILCISTVWTKQTPLSLKKNSGRIIGGEVARSGQFPYMAAIDVRTTDSTFFCGGALITNQWILTSAHCVYGAVSFTIRLGSNKLEGTDSNRVTVSTSHAIPHPDFNPDTLENDVGLIKLRSTVELGEHIQPIRLTLSDLPTSVVPTALGWGQTSDCTVSNDSQLASELQFVQLAVLSNEECRLVYGGQITDNMVCVEGNYNEGSCYGDSGGPLIATIIGNPFIQHVGVSSFFSGNGCESIDPSGYTRTYPYVAWIQNVTLN